MSNNPGKGSSFIQEEEKTNLKIIAPGSNNTQSSANLLSQQPPAPILKPQTTTNVNTQQVLLSRTNLSSAAPPQLQQSLALPKSSLNNQINGYTSSRANGGMIVHHKLQNSSKTNLHKQMHIIIEDKENRRDMINRQSNGQSIPQQPASNLQQSSSSTSLMKRSKTSDPMRITMSVKQQQTQKVGEQKTVNAEALALSST